MSFRLLHNIDFNVYDFIIECISWLVKVTGAYHLTGYIMLVRIRAGRRLRKILLQTELTPLLFVSLEISHLSVLRTFVTVTDSIQDSYT